MKKSALFVTFAPLVGITLIVWALRNHPWNALRVFGLGLAVVALALLTIARVQLGNSFSIAPEAHELVTRGLYSKIRHPVYVFGLLTLIGVALYANLPLLLLLLVILVPMQIVRARAEEKVLGIAFGDAYTQYKRGTWF